MKISPIQSNNKTSFGKLHSMEIDETVVTLGSKVTKAIQDALPKINEIDAPDIKIKIRREPITENFDYVGTCITGYTEKLQVFAQQIQTTMKKGLFGKQRKIEKLLERRQAEGIVNNAEEVKSLVEKPINEIIDFNKAKATFDEISEKLK